MRGFTFLLAFLGMTVAFPATPQPSDGCSIDANHGTDEANVFHGFRCMKNDPAGFTHLADDGVARSFDASGKILDAARVSPAQIKQLLGRLPATHAPLLPHLNEVFDGVSGMDVTEHAALFNPPKHLLPPEFQGIQGYTNEEFDKTRANAKTAEDFVSENPNYKVKRNLEARVLYCVGQYCVRSDSCHFMGCSTCLRIDMVVKPAAMCLD